MELTTKITREDFLNFYKHVTLKRLLKRSFFIATVFILLWIVLLNLNNSFSLPIILIETVFFYLVWGLLIFLLYQLDFQRIKRIPDKDGVIIGSKTYILQEDGFKEISKASETLTKWDGIKKIEETKDYIFVFVEKMTGYIIPKKSFREESEKNLFLLNLKEKIKS